MRPPQVSSACSTDGHVAPTRPQLLSGQTYPYRSRIQSRSNLRHQGSSPTRRYDPVLNLAGKAGEPCAKRPRSRRHDLGREWVRVYPGGGERGASAACHSYALATNAKVFHAPPHLGGEYGRRNPSEFGSSCRNWRLYIRRVAARPMSVTFFGEVFIGWALP